MSTNNRVATRSKNASQHPGYLVPKQTRRTSEEIAAIRRAKEQAKADKEAVKEAGIKRVAEFEQNQAQEDSVECTPRVTKPLVRTRSYADVLRSNVSDVEMADGTGPELAAVEDGQTTEDAMETEVEDVQPKKNVRFFFFFSPICRLIRRRSKRRNLGYGMPSRQSRIFRRREKILNARNYLSSPVIARRILRRGLLSLMAIYQLPPSVW